MSIIEGVDNLNVQFNQIKGGSGVDVWATRLSNELVKNGIMSSVNLFPFNHLFYSQIPKYNRKNHYKNEFITHSNSTCGFIFKEAGPLVVTEHHVVNDPVLAKYNSLKQKIYYKYVSLCEKKSFDIADYVTCVSNYTKNKLEEVHGYYDSKVIYNGVDEKFYRPIEVQKEKYGISPDKTVLFFVGNLSRRKGADLLPNIMNKLNDNYILLTTSGLRSNITNDMHNIRILGRLNDQELLSVYNLCDIFMFPSRLEGFGLSVAEAMACGKPIVTTDCSALPELVIDGKGGFLCKMDDIDDFATSIESLSQDKDLCNQMGKYNRNRVLKNFTLTTMTKEYIKLYSRF